MKSLYRFLVRAGLVLKRVAGGFVDFFKDLLDFYLASSVREKLGILADVVTLTVFFLAVLGAIKFGFVGVFMQQFVPLLESFFDRLLEPASEEVVVLSKCQAPAEIYGFLEQSRDEFDELFHRRYQDKWLPAGCWFLQVTGSGGKFREERWTHDLVDRDSGITVKVESEEDLSCWEPGENAEVVGRLAGVARHDHFVIADAKLFHPGEGTLTEDASGRECSRG